MRTRARICITVHTRAYAVRPASPWPAQRRGTHPMLTILTEGDRAQPAAPCVNCRSPGARSLPSRAHLLRRSWQQWVDQGTAARSCLKMASFGVGAREVCGDLRRHSEAGVREGSWRGGPAAAGPRRAGCRVLRSAEGRRELRRPQRWPVAGRRRECTTS